MKLIIRALILLLPIALGSCSHFSKSTFSQNRDKTYLSAKSIPPFKIPPGISSAAFHSKYPVSDRQYPSFVEDVSITPPGLNG